MKALIAITLLCVSFAVFSCKESSDEEPISGELTSCPENQTCSYKYYDNKIYKDWTLKSGSNRVFEAKFTQPGISRTFYINAPLNRASFSFEGDEIKESVLYNFNCPACDYIGVEPVNGRIKGEKKSGGKWLIDASIVLANEQVNYRDTVFIRQYFLR